MIQTRIVQSFTLAGFVPAGKPDYANGEQRFCSNSVEAMRLILAAAILSVAASGTAYCQPSGAVAQSKAESTLSVLYSFTGGTDGSAEPPPGGPLILDKAGNLYGATQFGGDLSCGFGQGCGVVFKLDPTGTETVFHSFTGGADGLAPNEPLARDAAGNLYGTTQGGGPTGWGVVFKLDRAGHEKVLYGFAGGTDGGLPGAGLIMDAGGNLYGTTEFGGDLSACSGSGCGVVFKVDPSGKETVLHAFTGGADGSVPTGSVVRDSAGNLYGGTARGGDLSCDSLSGLGCGVLFKIDPAGNETVLHTFTGGADGATPNSPLVGDRAGNLYGTTTNGGHVSGPCNFFVPGCGVVFKLDHTGKETVLYTFAGGPDGGLPYGGVVRDAAGNLYGTTFFFNDLNACQVGSGCGGVFKVDPAGNETVLYSFTGSTDGSYPETGLVSRKTGTAYEIYGITSEGGDLSCLDSGGFGCGGVFKISLPLADAPDPN